MQRYKSRIIYNKKKYSLNDEVADLFIKVLECVYYAKSVKYNYFAKSICDCYHIYFDLKIKKNKKYENIWNDFTYRLKKVKFNKNIIVHEIPDEDRINTKFIDKKDLK